MGTKNNCKTCGKKLRAAVSGYCSFECLSEKEDPEMLADQQHAWNE